MIRQNIKKGLAVALATILTLTGCVTKENRFGWAKHFEGKTAIAVVFVNDENCEWKEEDSQLKDRMLGYLNKACVFLKENASRLGAGTDFVYPCAKSFSPGEGGGVHDDRLVFETGIEGALLSDAPATEAVDKYLASEAVRSRRKSVMRDYKCDGIIYLFFIRTPEDNPTPSRSYMWMAPGDPEDEFSLICSHIDGMESGPAVMAHEILHAFGAVDLYTAKTQGYESKITEEYVKHLQEISSKDIMFSVFDTSGEGEKEMLYTRVGRDFSQLDAYYVGLADAPVEVEKYGLGKSMYE